jgi:hypothetical protein
MDKLGLARGIAEDQFLFAFQANGRPLIVANPAGDREFRALIDSSLLKGAGRPEDLEALLRTRYPQAIVRRRELAGEPTVVWYVYRDGHWIRSDRDAHT